MLRNKRHSSLSGRNSDRSSLQSSPLHLPRLLQLLQKTCPALCQQLGGTNRYWFIINKYFGTACSPCNVYLVSKQSEQGSIYSHVYDVYIYCIPYALTVCFPITYSMRSQPIFHTLYFMLHFAYICLNYRH